MLIQFRLPSIQETKQQKYSTANEKETFFFSQKNTFTEKRFKQTFKGFLSATYSSK